MALCHWGSLGKNTDRTETLPPGTTESGSEVTGRLVVLREPCLLCVACAVCWNACLACQCFKRAMSHLLLGFWPLLCCHDHDLAATTGCDCPVCRLHLGLSGNLMGP